MYVAHCLTFIRSRCEYLFSYPSRQDGSCRKDDREPQLPQSSYRYPISSEKNVVGHFIL